MATIQERSGKDGKIKYRALVRLNGLPEQSATFDRKTDAKMWAQKVEMDLLAGRVAFVHEARRRTAVEMLDRYLLDVVPRKEPAYRGQLKTQLAWWKTKLRGLKIAEVTPNVVASCRDELARTITRRGTPHTAASVNRHLAALSGVYTVAVREWRWADDSPVAKISKLREPRGRVRFLSNEERERLLEACRRSHNQYLYPVVVLALSTGMRHSEIMRLTWSCVDLVKGTVVLNHTKNGDRRAVPLAGHALEVVRELHGKKPEDSDMLFPSTVPVKRQSKAIEIARAWYKAVAEAELDDFRFHDLRHSAASYLAMSGATLAELSAVLGHKTLQMVKRYAHLTEDHTRQILERMNKSIFCEKLD